MEITYKIPYTVEDEQSRTVIHQYDRQYSSCLHIAYNFIKKNNLSISYANHITSGSSMLEHLYKMNNIDLITSHYWLRQCVINDACDIIKAETALMKFDKEKIKSYKEDIKEQKKRLEKAKKPKTKKKIQKKIDKLNHKIQLLQNKEYKTVFGGKQSFLDRCKKLITHKEFVENKLSPLYSKGSTEHFNRIFEILDDFKTILFKPTSDLHIELKLIGNAYENELKTLFFAQKYKELPCTFRLDNKYIYISYNNSRINPEKFSTREFLKNRVMSIDINPNYVGWIITDWFSENQFNIVQSGIYSIKDINDIHFSLKNKGYASTSKERKHLNNIREHSIFEISKALVNKALYYKCETFAYEKLVINSDDKNRGKKFNALCNNLWNRKKFIDNINKRCDYYHIEHRGQLPEYSSFIGNFLFRAIDLPDMCLAAFEIGRRAYQSRYNYSLPKEERKKNILFPDLEMFKDFLAISLEEFGLECSFQSLKNQYDSFKKSKTMYRLSIEDFNL